MREKYRRPKSFGHMLASEYRTAAESERSNAVKLDNDLGSVKKWIGTNSAVVGRERVSPSKGSGEVLPQYFTSFILCR